MLQATFNVNCRSILSTNAKQPFQSGVVRPQRPAALPLNTCSTCFPHYHVFQPGNLLPYWCYLQGLVATTVNVLCQPVAANGISIQYVLKTTTNTQALCHFTAASSEALQPTNQAGLLD